MEVNMDIKTGQKPQNHDFNTSAGITVPPKGLFQAGLRRGGRVGRLKSSSTCLFLPTLILHRSLLLTQLSLYLQPILTLLHCQLKKQHLKLQVQSYPIFTYQADLTLHLKVGGGGAHHSLERILHIVIWGQRVKFCSLD